MKVQRGAKIIFFIPDEYCLCEDADQGAYDQSKANGGQDFELDQIVLFRITFCISKKICLLVL